MLSTYYVNSTDTFNSKHLHCQISVSLYKFYKMRQKQLTNPF